SIDQRTVRRSLGCGHDWRLPVSWVKNRRPTATNSPQSQEPRQVQTNVASLSPHLGLALKDSTGQWDISGFQQQSNVRPTAHRRPVGSARESAVQQSNLGLHATTSLHLQQGPGQRAPPSLRAQQASLGTAPSISPSISNRLSTGFTHLDGQMQLEDPSWHRLGGWAPRLLEEPLTLEDLAVPRQARAPSPAALHQLLTAVRQLEHRAISLSCQEAWKPPGPAQQGPDYSWSPPTHPQPCQPGFTSLDEKKQARGPRRTARASEMTAPQAGLQDYPVPSKPGSPKATSGVVTHGFLDSEQGPGQKYPQWPTCGRRHKVASSLTRGELSFPSSTGRVLRKWEGEKAQGQQANRKEETTTSGLPNPALSCRSVQQSKAQSIVVQELQATGWQLLPTYFGAWRHLAQRRQAMAMAEALRHRQLLQKGLQALRWTLWLREAQLEVARGQYTKALLARSFQEWRRLVLQPPPTQAASGPPTSRRSRSQDPGRSSGRKTVEDATRRSSPGPRWLAEGARSVPLQPGQRPHVRDSKVRVLQALHYLAAFLLWCYQKDQARREKQEKGTLAEAPGAAPRTQRTGGSPQAWGLRATEVAAVPHSQRAWLRRCFGAWHRFMRRRAQCQELLASRRVRMLRLCLQRWLQMKWLRASDGARVMQLALCWQRAGSLVGSDSGASRAHSLRTATQAQARKQYSLQEACRSLALQRVLRLWMTRLRQHQQATSFSQGIQRRLLRDILSWWRGRAWSLDTGSDSGETTSALKPWGCSRQQAWLGCSSTQGALEEDHVQRAAIIWLQQTGVRCLQWTHWAQGAGPMHWPRLASRGHLNPDTPVPWEQPHSCWPQPWSTWQPYCTGQRLQRDTCWVDSEVQPSGHSLSGGRELPLCPAFQLWLERPRLGNSASNQPPAASVKPCGSETSALQDQGPWQRLGRKALQCWRLETLLHRVQASQQARRLALTWQRWVDTKGVEQLSRTLLRQWHLGQAWRTWRRSAVRLRVAQKLRQEEERWVLSQAFKKWHQCVTDSQEPQEQGEGPGVAHREWATRRPRTQARSFPGS
ncbi:uncharacterized protein C1orf167 homolog, partial [Thomomys bottae]